MTLKVDKALKRLNDILPLKKKYNNCSSQIKSLYQEILKSFVLTGRILSKDEISIYVTDVNAAIKILDENEMVVTSKDKELVGAYPFTMEDREYKVVINGNEVNAMCAIDALAVSLMFNVDTQIKSRCRITDIPIYLEQSGAHICNFDENRDVHICVAWEAVKDDIKCANSLCMEMFFVSSKEIANTWKKNEHKKKDIFTLDEAMELSKRFFVPLVS